MGLKQKLLSGYLIIILAAGIVGYFGVQQINTIKLAYFKVNEQTIPLISVLQKIRASSLQILSSTIEYAFLANELQLTKHSQANALLGEEVLEIDSSTRALQEALKEYQQLVALYFPDEEEYLGTIKTSSTDLISTSKKIIELKTDNLDTSVLELKEQLEENENILLSTFDKAMSHERSELIERKEQVAHSIDNAITTMLSVGAIALILSVISALLIGRSVIKPVKQLNDAAEKMAAGDFTQRMNVTSEDEIGKLSIAFNYMTNELQMLYNNLEDKVQKRTRQLEQANEELVKSERLATLGQVTAIVSHELRNPLGTIRSSLFTVGEKVRDKQLGVERALDRMERNISRCDNIIEELLDYTRHRNLKTEETDINSWLNNLLDETNIPPEVKLTLETNAANKVNLDSERLRQALVNILNNAIEAITSQGTGDKGNSIIPAAGEITISTSQTDGELIINIKDNGPGIDQEQINKIFEPLHSTKSFGVGLGLPIAKQIIIQHHGEIRLTSESGKGTNVEIIIPTNTDIMTKEVSNG